MFLTSLCFSFTTVSVDAGPRVDTTCKRKAKGHRQARKNKRKAVRRAKAQGRKKHKEKSKGRLIRVTVKVSYPFWAMLYSCMCEIQTYVFLS